MVFGTGITDFFHRNLAFDFIIVVLFCRRMLAARCLVSDQMRDRAAAATHISDLGDVYWRLYRSWVTLGALAFPALVAIFWLMVSKPDL